MQKRGFSCTVNYLKRAPLVIQSKRSAIKIFNIADTAEWTKIAKAQAEIAETATKYAEYMETEREMNAALEEVKRESDTGARRFRI